MTTLLELLLFPEMLAVNISQSVFALFSPIGSTTSFEQEESSFWNHKFRCLSGSPKNGSSIFQIYGLLMFDHPNVSIRSSHSEKSGPQDSDTRTPSPSECGDAVGKPMEPRADSLSNGQLTWCSKSIYVGSFSMDVRCIKNVKQFIFFERKALHALH